MRALSPSLRVTIQRLTVQASIATAVIAALGMASYWILNREISRKNTLSEMTKNADRQIRDLLPSFLLIEQKAGLNALLEKIESTESLNSIAVIEGDDAIALQSCRPREGFFECPVDRPNSIAIAIPIVVGDQHFGYLLKDKKVTAPISSENLLWLSISFLAILVAFSLVLIRLFNKLTAQDIPDSLDRLVNWIENWLRGMDQNLHEDLRFAEFDRLAAKIAQIFSKHEEERNQAIVGQLSSGILHDIKNDLQSILAAQCLTEEQPVDSEKRLQRLENTHRVLTKKMPNLIGIVETTLDLNRDINLKSKFASIERTLQKSVESLSEKTADLGAQIIIDSPTEPISLFHDAVQVQRVFANLIGNALDSISAVPVPQRLICISFEKSDGSLKIRVEDGGQGLPEPLPDLFRAFTSTKKNGTGLGLFNSQKIIKSHGGKINVVAPRRLGGACFEVNIPRGGYFGTI